MKIKQEILNRSIKHENHMFQVLKDGEYQKIYLRLSKLNGSNVLFFDIVDLNNDLELLNLYANLLKNNIIILTFMVRK